MVEERFHPIVQRWFEDRFEGPTEAQEVGWKAIGSGNDTLIAAPTGSGKTLAAFLWSIDRLVRASLAGELEDRTYVIYVSPLKALGNDIRKNLQDPLSGIEALAEQFALPEAVEELRKVRRETEGEEIVTLSASDPLNLVGILTPGERVSPLSRQMILFERGVPVEIGSVGTIRHYQSRIQNRSTEPT